MAEGTDTTASQSQEGAEGAKPEGQDVDWKAKYEDMRGHMREWQSRAESNKAAADELAQLKESQLSETEKLTRRAEKAEKALSDLKAANEIAGWKTAASEKYGVPVSLINGSTEDEIDANAEALKKWHDPEPQGGLPLSGTGEMPSGKLPDSAAADFERAAKKLGF